MPTRRTVSPARLAEALSECAKVVGSEWVFRSEEDISLYCDSYTPFVGQPEKEIMPGGAVAPASVEEVQAVVRIANKYGTPVYPISTGRNLGYGGTAPTMSGTIVLDLKRMNRIVEFNEKEAYAVVEPGVSFLDFHRYLQEHKLDFLVASPEPGWGSPIGNALEHGISIIAGDNFAQVHGMEVVLPTGELIRTGSGASANSRLWQNYRYGFGPYIDGMFSQSNFGVVTKMGVWLHRATGVQKTFVVTSPRHDDLVPMLEKIQLMRELQLVRFSGCGSPIRSCTSMVNGAMPRNIPGVRALLARKDGGSPAEWEQLGRENNLPVSLVSGTLRGPPRIVDATLEHIREVFSDLPNATVTAQPSVKLPANPDELNEEQKYGYGIPTLWGFTRLIVHGTTQGHYFFSPLMKPTVDDLFALNNLIRGVMIDAGDTGMLEHFGWQGGYGAYPKAFMFMVDFLVYDDVAKNQRRMELFKRLVKACAEQGFTEYRAPIGLQDLVMDSYSFNNHALLRFHETVKDAIDPNGIMAPGKSGIWPRKYRGEPR